MIKLASPDIRPSDIERAVRVIKSGNLVQGETVVELEAALSTFTKIPHSAIVSSGTAALHLALLALGIGPGDKVVVPAFTFPATANAVENTGASVLLCDVDPRKYVMMPRSLEETLSENPGPEVKAVLVVHEFGYPVEMRSIAQIAKRHGLIVVEDAACALGTVADGEHVGYFGHVACFSFHPRKAITTGEGGAVLSKDSSLIGRVKMYRNHGIKQEGTERDFIVPGLNYRMTEFQAALAQGQLERFPGEIERRRKIAQQYLFTLSGLESLSLPEMGEGHSWQSFMVVLDDRLDRDDVIESLFEAGIETSLGAQALNSLKYYKLKYGLSEQAFPIATRLYRQGLALPIYGKLSDLDVETITKAVLGYFIG